VPFDSSLLPLAQAQSGGTREIVDNLARTPLSQVVTFVVILTVIRVVIYPFIRNRKSGPITTVGRGLNEMLDAFIYAGVFVFMLIRPFGVQAFLIPSGSMWPALYVNDFIVANKAVYRYSDPKVNDIVVFRPPATAQVEPGQLDADGQMKVDFIKRCIGTPGDVIEVKKGVLYRNGQPVDETYKAYSECTDESRQAECQQFRMLTADEKSHLTMTSFKLIKYKDKVIPLNYDDSDANSPSPQRQYSEREQPYHVAAPFEIPDPDEERRAEALPAVAVPKGMYLMMGDNRNNSYDGRGWGLVPREQIIGRAEFVWWPLSRIHRTR